MKDREREREEGEILCMSVCNGGRGEGGEGDGL